HLLLTNLYIIWANHCIKTNDYKEAEKLFNCALREDSSNNTRVSCQFELARICDEQNKQQETMEALKQVIDASQQLSEFDAEFQQAFKAWVEFAKKKQNYQIAEDLAKRAIALSNNKKYQLSI